VITALEFDDMISIGRELVLLEDLVLDIGAYKYEHPGGLFSLQHNSGRDVTKYFHGGYAMEEGVTPHQHSGVARAIVNSLIIGRLGNSTQSCEAKVLSKRDVTVNTSAFLIDGPLVPEISLDNIGKSYLVTAKTENGFEITR